MKDYCDRKEIEVGRKCWIRDDSYVTVLTQGFIQTSRLPAWYKDPADVEFVVVSFGGSYPSYGEGMRDVAQENNVILWEPKDDTYWFVHNSRIVMI